MTQTTNTPIGLLGDARSVSAIANQLAAAGHRVIVYAPPGYETLRASKRIERAATPTDVAYECRVVLSRLWTNETLRDVILGDEHRDGLGGDMHAGSVFVDLCARLPRDLQALLGLLGTRAVSVVDAALVDTEPRTVLLGGFPDAADIAQPVLAVLATVARTGPLGSAHTAAAILATRDIAQRAAVDAARALATRLGITGDRLDALVAELHIDTEPDDTAARLALARQLSEQSNGEPSASPFAIQRQHTRLRIA